MTAVSLIVRMKIENKTKNAESGLGLWHKTYLNPPPDQFYNYRLINSHRERAVH